MLSILAAASLLQAAGGAAPAAAPERPAVVIPPAWLRKPTGADISRVYPRQALARRVEGSATISCVVEETGALGNCTILEESPTGEGFGAAALQLAPLFAMRLMTKDGVAVSGGTVRIPVRWTLPRR